jgi:Ca2+-binding RTX toxin-like protein
VITALVIAPAFFQAAVGKTDPVNPGGKGKPGQLAAPKPAGPDCDLSLGDSPKDEFANCTDVVLSAGSTPDLGATTTIDVAVTSVTDLTGAKLTLAVNDGFEIASADGFSDAGDKASGVGTLSAVARTIDVTANQAAHFSIDVTGVKGGTGIVQASLNAANNAFDGGDELDVQLGSAAPVSQRGYATSKVPAGTRLAAPADAPAPRAVPPGKKPKQLSADAANADCATGSFRFNDEHGVSQPSAFIRVEIWDQDSPSGDDLLTWNYADAAGNYNICFESTDGEGGGQEVYVRFVTDAVAWRVRNTAASNTTYAWVSGVFNYADPGGSHSFGSLQPADLTQHRALHAYDGLEKLWNWHYSLNNYLDNPGDSRGVVLNWTSTSSDGTYYSTATKDIHLAAADPDADHTTIHEGSHALMDALYNDDWPPVTNCNPHSIFGPSSTTCAWTEGWAEWVPARVLDDPFYRWPDGASLDLENEGWSTFTGAYGDTSEGRIAGTLIDLSDSNNEAYWDRYTEGGGNAASEEIIATMEAGQVSDTLNEYFNVDRPGEGDTGYLARAAVFQNTIDYTNRDPLFSTQELTRPGLNLTPTPHRYSYSANSAYWGGVAIRPNAGADYDLTLYSDEAQTSFIGSSSAGGSTIDYVLVDGNHRTGTFFPRAGFFAGSGSYNIEEYTGGTILGVGTSGAYSFGSGDIIRPFDASVAAAQTQYIGVVPSAGLDVSVQAHVSDGTSAGAVRSRSSAVASANGGGAGVTEFLTYSAAAADWTGVVVLNENAGTGSFTVYRDTAVPTGSVVVDGGNAQTYDTTVDLTLAATPANTPVTEMQISTDGTFDSEPWVAYNTSATATVPAGNGTKTVSVRYRSAAGAVSATATDDINLVPVPTCNGLTATVFGNGTVTGTPGNDVIVGGPGADAISGQGGNDTICGLGGNDSINDGAGADQVFGDNGNDVFNQPAAVDNGDVFDGGAGTDQVSYAPRSGDVNVTLDATNNDGVAGEGDFVMSTVENVTTGSGNDTIVGSPVPNRLIGNGGNDTISGAAGNDYLAGVGGNDTLRGVDGNDTILGGDGDDTVDEGNAANGTDVIKGGAGFNKITYAARTTAVTISLTGAPNSGAAGENDKVIAFQWAIGGSGNDTIVGHTTADTLTGNGGNDTMSGNGGNDTMSGNAGNDTLNGGNGNDALDTVDSVNGNDTANGAAGTDTATTDPGDIRISIP